ncbi:MAG: hypothetical protein JSS81_13750 [Acidobacteria bacterium]|nr:hypothetical protein [Acidobacteriota bacterium]
MRAILIFCLFFLFAPAAFGQSCGGGTAYFHIFDERGEKEIADAAVRLFVVSEDQSWMLADFTDRGWMRQTFDETVARKYAGRPRVSFETAYAIPAGEFARLVEERRRALEKNPRSPIVEAEKVIAEKPKPANERVFSAGTREGCSFMAAAEIAAAGFETAWFVSDFTCGCTKHYEFRLRAKSE